MDLRSVASVIGRHKTAAAVGAVLAFVLAFLAAYRLDFAKTPPLERRQATIYESTSRIFVTQEGFPWGRSALRYTTTQGQPPLLEGDPDRFAQLALLYSQLANSDRVLGALGKRDQAAVAAKVVPVSQFNSAPLPMIDISARAESPARARKLAATVTDSLVRFIRRNQASSNIPARERVVLEVIDPADLGKVLNAPSPALPLLVFLTVVFATVGGIFVLDNWRGGGAYRHASASDTSTAHADLSAAPEPVPATPAVADHRPRIARSGPAATLGQRRPTLAEQETAPRGVVSAAGEE